jgi:hypothetical protein
MEIPALRILHALSKVVKQRPDLEAGHFYHRSSRRIWVTSSTSSSPRPPLGRAQDAEGSARQGVPPDPGARHGRQDWDKPNQRFQVTLPGGRKGEYFTDKNVDSGLLEWGSSDPADRNSLPAAQHVYTTIMRLIEPQSRAR